MLGQRRRRWPNIEPTPGGLLVFAGDGCICKVSLWRRSTAAYVAGVDRGTLLLKGRIWRFAKCHIRPFNSELMIRARVTILSQGWHHLKRTPDLSDKVWRIALTPYKSDNTAAHCPIPSPWRRTTLNGRAIQFECLSCHIQYLFVP